MLKLNASYSKKIPANQEYSSKGYSASLEVELPDGLTQEQLQDRIHATFALVEAAVESEINGKGMAESKQPPQSMPQYQAQPAVQYPSQPVTQAPSFQHHPPQPPTQNRGRSASSKQIKFLTDIARTKNISLGSYLQNYGLANIEDLNGKQCSELIDMIRAQRAA